MKTKSKLYKSCSKFRRLRKGKINFPAILGILATTFSFAAKSEAQIFVANTDSGIVGEYNTDGSAINSDLITFSSGAHPYSIQTDGTSLYIDSSTNDDLVKYSLSGVSEGTVISNLHVPRGFIIDGSDIFVLNSSTDTLGEYTLAGAAVHTNLATFTASPYKIAASGTDLFITTANGVSEFDTVTGQINNSFITGYTELRGIAVSGNDIFVSDFTDDTVKEFSLAGTLLNGKFIDTVVDEPDTLTASGNDLFIGDDGSQCVTEFTNTGTLVKGGLIKGLDDPSGILVEAPEPSTYALLLGGLIACGIFRLGLVRNRFGWAS